MPLIRQVVLIVEREKRKKRISSKYIGVDDRDTHVKRTHDECVRLLLMVLITLYLNLYVCNIKVQDFYIYDIVNEVVIL